MSRTYQNRANYPRGFIGLNLTLYPGLNELDPATVQLFISNCPRFKTLVTPPANTTDSRRPLKSPVQLLQSKDGKARINYLNNDPTSFNCPKVLFPAYRPNIKDNLGNLVYDGKAVVSDADYAALMSGLTPDAQAFQAQIAEGQIRPL